jgi:hypothetical protein
MDSCLGTLGGCFLWIFLFAIAYILIHIFVGIFWLALVGAIVILIIFGVLAVLGNFILSLFEKKKK